MIHIILLFTFLIFSVNAETHIVILMISAPKKVPMIVYTADYFVNSYKKGHGDIVIDGVFITKGCDGCEHPDVDEAKKIIETAGIPVFINDRTDKDILYDENYMQWSYDFFQPWYLVVSDVPMHRMVKSDRINTYFNSTLTYALEKFPETEYVLYLEDDVAIYSNGFSGLDSLIKNYKNDEKKAISSQIGCHKCKMKRGVQTKCIYGFFSKFFNRNELKTFLRLQKFSWHVVCGDAVECMWQKATGLGRRLEHFLYHFGRNKNIKRYDSKFM